MRGPSEVDEPYPLHIGVPAPNVGSLRGSPRRGALGSLRRMARRRNLGSTLALLAVIAIVYYLKQKDSRPEPPPRTGGTAANEAASGSIESLFEAGQSDTWVESSGRVQRVLADDNEGSRHQRFLLELASGHTILIAHNIDVAPRVPLETGDEIRFRGEFEWSDRGGVVHWTHRDTRGRKKGGWLELAGKTYR